MTNEFQLDASQPSEPGRFEVVRLLGSGGMASVFEVLDRANQRKLALKRLHPTADAHRQRRMVELFEREFYTLSQITHPFIVEAYDYGVDDEGAYYTMELLDGGELQTLAPLPHKRACEIARDICSALSLLHSRRMVYRDLNPRNVHCTVQGTPKLIDFGAIVSMGPCAQVVGTPAYCAPETLDLRPLDARTDLFSLGATLYFALTGQHAYPAKTFAQLRQVWTCPPARPASLVPDVPAALDSLVMDLLNLDPSDRPANAGELVEQLAAISGQTVNEQLGVVQAYLSTPNLVGRETQLTQVRSKLRRTMRGHGSALLITSGSGMGRSRFLAAVLLEAKMSGALAIHAAASEIDGDYAVIRALGRCLLDAAPDLAEWAARDQRETLAQVLPELAEPQPEPAQRITATTIDRSKMLAAMRDWFTALARGRPLMIAVDDFHRVDEPSAACLAFISRETSKCPLLLAVSCETETNVAAPPALKLYENIADRVSLANLSAAQTEELLGSVFGSVPQVQLVARKLHAIANGNPRDTIRLAQHLVDCGVARYRSGGWLLPSNFDDLALPASMTQAVVSEFEALGSAARQLARVLSLAGDRALGFDECVTVFPDLLSKSVHDGLQQLLRAQLAKLEAGLFTIAHRGLHAALQSGIDEAELNSIHDKLAQVFGLRDDEQFRQAKHLLLAGNTQRGIDVLVAFATSTQLRTDQDPNAYVQLVASMPEDWLDVFSAAILGCTQLGRSRTEVFRLRNRLGSLLNVMGAPVAASHEHLIALIRQLCEESGLDDYTKLNPGLDRADRLRQAIAAAKQRYEASPELTRGLEPGLAMRCLVRAQLLAAGIVALSIDYPLGAALPSLAPLAPLSPAFEIIEKLVGAVTARVAGRQDYAREVYRQILERTAQPDLAGLDPSNHRFLRFGVMYGLAVIEAGMGLASSLAWAETLESEPLHAVNALQVKMIYELWLGRVREADQVRERAELRRIEIGSRQMADGTHLVWQTIAHAYSDDLTHMKQVTEELRPLAHRYAGWTCVVEYALAEYHRMRGDATSALDHVTAVLNNLSAGTHQIWAHAAATHIGLLTTLNRTDEAVTLGEAYLQAAEHADQGYLANYIRMPLAIAYARLGQHAHAAEQSERVLLEFRELGTAGLNLVLAYETRSRVALHAENVQDYERFAALCADECRKAGGRALRAKHDRLVWAANAGALAPARTAAASLGTSVLETALKSVFSDCEQPRMRAERALQLLLTSSRALEGVLYLIGQRGPEQVAKVGRADTAIDLRSSILEFIHSELEEQGLATASVDGDESMSALITQIGQRVLVLLSHQTSDGVAVTGVAALAPSAGVPFVHPGSVAARLSRMLAEAGDAVPLTSG